MGATAYAVRRHTYLDSVFLMRVARALGDEPGVSNVAALMATEANKQTLRAAGFTGDQVDGAAADDLVVGVTAATREQADTAIARLDVLLSVSRPDGGRRKAGGWSEAVALLPRANLAVISVPGEHAAAEIEHALDQGLHVFCFSSNVALADEVALKRKAQSRGLLLMGPDCGTAIVAGTGVGFANVVRRGPIGIVGGSGTGMQAITSLIDAAGSGVSHAIGCGSRDLSDEVGGITTFAGLDALLDDAGTRVVVVVSKTPGISTLKRLEEVASRAAKPVVTCFVGGAAAGGVATFEAAAAEALRLAGVAAQSNGAVSERAVSVSGRALGLFAGGSLMREAEGILEQSGVERSRYELIDMGDEEFTRGRAHPMIDWRLRAERVAAAGGDPTVGVLLLDFVLGRGASPDPAGDLVPAIVESRGRAATAGRSLSVIASVIGTDGDPQGRRLQVERLRQAGVTVMPTSAAAARRVAEALR